MFWGGPFPQKKWISGYGPGPQGGSKIHPAPPRLLDLATALLYGDQTFTGYFKMVHLISNKHNSVVIRQVKMWHSPNERGET